MNHKVLQWVMGGSPILKELVEYKAQSVIVSIISLIPSMNTVQFFSERHKFLYTFSGHLYTSTSEEENLPQALAQEIGGCSSVCNPYNGQVSDTHPSSGRFSSSFYINDTDRGCQSEYPTCPWRDEDMTHAGINWVSMVFLQTGEREDSFLSVSKCVLTWAPRLPWSWFLPNGNRGFESLKFTHTHTSSSSSSSSLSSLGDRRKTLTPWWN